MRSHASLTKGKKYDLKLLINSSLIFTDTEIKITMEDNSFIQLSPNTITYSNNDIKENGLVVKDVIIKALEITNSPILIKATVNNYMANVLIDVIEQEIHDPLNGLEFYKDSLVLSPDNIHKACLYFDKSIVPIGSSITLKSDGLILNQNQIIVSDNFLLDENIGCIVVKSKGGDIGSDYLITANYKGIETNVKITILETSKNNNSGGGLISGLKLEPDEDQYYQAYFHPFTREIIINSKNSVNIAIMGSMDDKNPDNPSFNKEQTKYLCDLIALQASQELVKEQNARKGEINIDNVKDAVEEIQNLIQQQKNKIFMVIYPVMISISD